MVYICIGLHTLRTTKADQKRKTDLRKKMKILYSNIVLYTHIYCVQFTNTCVQCIFVRTYYKCNCMNIFFFVFVASLNDMNLNLYECT